MIRSILLCCAFVAATLNVCHGDDLLLFSASWCGPCRALKADMQRHRVAATSVIDVDQNPELSKQYEIKALPTLLIIRNEQEIGRWVGANGWKRWYDGVFERSLGPVFMLRVRTPDNVVSIGSCVCVQSDNQGNATFVTSLHVVDDARKIEVQLPLVYRSENASPQRLMHFSAKVVKRDEPTELAVIQSTGLPFPLDARRVFNGDVTDGMRAESFGAAQGKWRRMEITVSTRDPGTGGRTPGFLYSNLPFDFGESGGGVFYKGQLIGVVYGRTKDRYGRPQHGLMSNAHSIREILSEACIMGVPASCDGNCDAACRCGCQSPPQSPSPASVPGIRAPTTPAPGADVSHRIRSIESQLGAITQAIESGQLRGPSVESDVDSESEQADSSATGEPVIPAQETPVATEQDEASDEQQGASPNVGMEMSPTASRRGVIAWVADALGVAVPVAGVLTGIAGTGGIATLAIPLVSWWLKRKPVMSTLDRIERRSKEQKQDQPPVVVTSDTPPPPQAIYTETHFTPYERDTYAEAYAWAKSQMSRKYPGSVSTMETIDSYIKQYISSQHKAA